MRYVRCADRRLAWCSAFPLLLAAVALTAACARFAPPATAPAAPPEAAAPASPATPPVAATPAGAPAQPGTASERPARPAASRPPGPPPLLGHLTRDELKAYSTWQPLFDTPYEPDRSAVETIRTHVGNVTTLAIVATWCPDSKREVPRFFAIMDKAGISEASVTLVGVDRSKKDAEGLTDKWGITRVPTMVFLRDGREIGRFVERTPAETTLEAEIAKILAGR